MFKKILYNQRLELVVFFCGAIVMILELVASRVIAPYFGNSLVIWTSLIGIILGSLSAGYYFGGMVADRSQSYDTLSKIISISAILVGVTAFTKEPVLGYVSRLLGSDIGAASFLGILILFGPASFALGIVSPYAARLKLVNLKNSGKVVGNLYALSTLGSIIGTFLAGFFLIPAFGNVNLLYGMAISLWWVSVLAANKLSLKSLLLLVVILALYEVNVILGVFRFLAIEDVDSSYNRIQVKILNNPRDGQILSMGTDNSGIQSAFRLNSPDELYFEYTKAYAASLAVKPNIGNALMIGGGGYSFPRYFLSQQKEATIDVVEIDSKMTELAKKYFGLKPDIRLKIFHQDARLFLKNTETKYDLIFLDAFNSITPPHHLTTREFMGNLKSHLNEDGILILNLISSLTGPNASFLRAEVKTLNSIFEKVEIRKMKNYRPDQIQNFLIMAYGLPLDTSRLSQYPLVYLDNKTSDILTDDWSPVEYMTRGYYTNL